MVISLKREDGETGDVWIVAGVPDHLQKQAKDTGHSYGFQDVRVFGDSIEMWCPKSFMGGGDLPLYDGMEEIVEACKVAALETHAERLRK